MCCCCIFSFQFLKDLLRFFFFTFIELPEKHEQLHAIYKVLEELPTANFNTLERLVFHLVRYLIWDYDVEFKKQCYHT